MCVCMLLSLNNNARIVKYKSPYNEINATNVLCDHKLIYRFISQLTLKVYGRAYFYTKHIFERYTEIKQ